MGSHQYSVGVTVERVTGGKKGKRGKPKKTISEAVPKTSNYALLIKLGFAQSVIQENSKLGLKMKDIDIERNLN
jgi:hypothetical protein